MSFYFEKEKFIFFKFFFFKNYFNTSLITSYIFHLKGFFFNFFLHSYNLYFRKIFQVKASFQMLALRRRVKMFLKVVSFIRFFTRSA